MPKASQETKGLGSYDPKSATEKKFVITHRIKNISTLNIGNTYTSDVEDHFGFLWHLSYIYDGRFLRTTLNIDVNGRSALWSVGMKVRHMFVTKNGADHFHNSTDHVFSQEHNYGLTAITFFEDIKNKIFDDDMVYVDVEVTITKTSGFDRKKLRNFDTPENDWHVVLVAGGQKFYARTVVICNPNTDICELDVARGTEIVLENEDPLDLQIFLEALHGEDVISDTTLEIILLLAIKYRAIEIFSKCEKWLLEGSKMSPRKQLQMAIRCSFWELEQKCLSELKTKQDIQAVLPANLMSLDPNMVLTLFEKLLTVT
ncbi:MATH domain-containing protein [Caenorhabditis elegans]|uniref:MATH domain-containing protein n=1 Tax=Caenorhabditis elegans TaxID=6239 RepID=O76611_CAEEL|nr:MATH domain-containing protein [Caenorhabditis elegans]CCD63701.1 MATH domain-containing protein [Caenorhabditis elegans]|eukprot:NP_494005.2 BTB and MATH domain containing [Caenorhabditis elegans]